MDRAAAEISAALRGQLEPTWDAAWHAISLLRALPETASAGRRWAADRDSFTRFSSYLADGGLPQPRRDRAATAAARLDRLERAQAAYDAERALEDPFVLAELRTSGEAFAGEVVSAEPSRTIITAAGRPVLRPRFTVRTGDPVRLEPGRVLICPAHHRQRVQIADLTRTAADADACRPRSRPGNGHARQADARRGTRCRGTGQLHARPRVLCPAGLPAARPDPVDARRTPRPAVRRPRRGDAIMSGDRPYDPAAETDRVIAAVLADMARPGQRGVIVDSPPGDRYVRLQPKNLSAQPCGNRFRKRFNFLRLRENVRRNPHSRRTIARPYRALVAFRGNFARSPFVLKKLTSPP